MIICFFCRKSLPSEEVTPLTHIGKRQAIETDCTALIDPHKEAPDFIRVDDEEPFYDFSLVGVGEPVLYPPWYD